MLPKLTLVIGGAASGKSAFAERLVTQTARPRRYIATAQVLDAEMQARADRHRARRDTGWTTVEAPLDTAAALHDTTRDEIVLLDCATLWLTNQMLSGNHPATETARLLRALKTAPAPVVVVSNEVGSGIVPENALSRRFRDEQGRLNQRLAAQAGLVVTVIAGLPLVLKGVLPEGAA